MIWLTVRQFRAQAVVGLAALAALAAVLAFTGPGIADEYADGIAACGGAEPCDQLKGLGEYQTFHIALMLIILAVPPLIGLFWGAPLITHELEAGTHRLVWNQSITRTRWLAVKLVVVGATAMVLTEAAALAVGWWSDPLVRASSEFPRLDPVPFATGGIVPLGYAAFAFVLGVAFGVLVRKTLPAMAFTLAVFAAVQVAMPMLIRPHVIPPEVSMVSLTRENLGQFMVRADHIEVDVQTVAPGTWVLSSSTVDASGRDIAGLPTSLAAGACAPTPQKGPVGPPEACFAEIARLGYRQRVTYQPADRYWAFQWTETGVFAVLALGLAGLCFYRVRRLS